MPETKITDLFDAQIWAGANQEASTAKNAFIASGVVVNDNVISTQLKGGANQVDLGYWEGLDDAGEPNVSSDTLANEATTEKITTKTQIARSASLNKVWSFASLAREFNPLSQDPVAAVTSRTGGYWAKQNQNRLVQTANGILADNILNGSSDMLFNSAGSPAAIAASMINEAAQTMGDAKDILASICVHSRIETSLRNLKLLEPIFDSSGAFLFNTYLGKRVIVDDTMPVDTSGADDIYTSIVFGAGAFGYGEGTVDTPMEMDRKATAGDGGGYDILVSRINPCFHPYGYTFNSASVAGKSPTAAELALAANWTRVSARKSVGIAFLKSLA